QIVTPTVGTTLSHSRRQRRGIYVSQTNLSTAFFRIPVEPNFLVASLSNLSFVFSNLLSSLALCGAAVSSDDRVIGATRFAVNPLHDKNDIFRFLRPPDCGKHDWITRDFRRLPPFVHFIRFFRSFLPL
ncbi:hypothetical protein, partial [Devosia sp. Root685]|uniref:hypothetical protein n=1 Tax=Devosia sp. Root685 TaxID=1736587 RepID=UPI001AEBA673